MDTEIEQRLDKLDQGQVEIMRRLDRMAHVQRNIVVELGGVPDDLGRDPHRRTIRARIHSLEDDRTANVLAAQALKGAQQLHDAAGEKRFSRAEKIVGLLLALAVVLSTWLAPIVFHHSS